jgi:ribonuclease HI
MTDIDTSLKQVEIFTDGACTGNPGPGGYGAILKSDEKEIELSAGYRKTTNNRMELMAVITGLQKLRFRCSVKLYTDSQYVANGIKLGWAKKWKANRWRKATGEPALNIDLWATLLDLCDEHDVHFIWVKGHAGHPENERCDKLSVAASRGKNLLSDEVYEGLRTLGIR